MALPWLRRQIREKRILGFAWMSSLRIAQPMTRRIEIGLNSKQTKNTDRGEVGSGWSGMMSVWDVSVRGWLNKVGTECLHVHFKSSCVHLLACRRLGDAYTSERAEPASVWVCV